MKTWRYERNRFLSEGSLPTWSDVPDDVRAFHRTLPGYNPTPLVELPVIADSLGVRELRVKDESKRFALDAFKALGASYAIHRLLQAQGARRSWTFCTATDGNHGRAVAWTARRLGRKAVVFVPGNTVAARISAIEAEHAKVVVVKGTYDDAVREAARQARAEGWEVVSDTAYVGGDMDIPRWIMEGYGTIFEELAEQAFAPDLILVQAGVGGLLCAATLWYKRHGASPNLVSVEPMAADCLLASIASPGGNIRSVRGRQNSIMAGLNCGTPSLLAWPVIRQGVHAFLAIDDGFAIEAMKMYAKSGITSGESGAAGLAGLIVLSREPSLAEARRQLSFGVDTRVLLINTEGATDPDHYRRLVS